MDEAVHFGHHDVVTILRDYHNKYSPQESSEDKQSAEKNLDGMLWSGRERQVGEQQSTTAPKRH